MLLMGYMALLMLLLLLESRILPPKMVNFLHSRTMVEPILMELRT